MIMIANLTRVLFLSLEALRTLCTRGIILTLET
jgi:hypothetical protein